MSQESGEKRPKVPAQDVKVLTELDQIKVLADPLRIRILEELVEARTTKQVAELLGEKSTKLYHHVEALERVGLIRLTHTRQNRGTLEKYYQAVAKTFRADASAFSASSESTDEEKNVFRQVVGTIFESSAAEITALIDSGCTDSIEKEGLLSFIEVRANEKDLLELRKRLESTLEWLSSQADKPDEDEASLDRYRLTLAFFPLEPGKRR